MQKVLFRLATVPKVWFTQSCKNASNFLYERARAGENVHFLKIQREQLMKLRSKLVQQQNEVQSELGKVDQQMVSMAKVTTGQSGKQ